MANAAYWAKVAQAGKIDKTVRHPGAKKSRRVKKGKK